MMKRKLRLRIGLPNKFKKINLFFDSDQDK